MRTETDTITRYFKKYNELSVDSQLKVIENNREYHVSDEFWFEGLLESFGEILEALGFADPKIYFSHSYSQGDGACFESRYFSHEKGMVKKVQEIWNDEELVVIAKQLQKIYAKSFYQVTGKIRHSGRYCHENSMSVELNGCYHLEDEVKEFCRDFSCWMFDKIQDEYDFKTSKEFIHDWFSDSDDEFEVNEDGEFEG